jgi:hypothetical protein
MLGVTEMQGIAAGMDDQGDTRYSHKEVRALLHAQLDHTRKELEAI